MRLSALILSAFIGLFAASPASSAGGAPPADSSAVAAAMVPAHAFTERAYGRDDAPVTLVEYAMLTCPHCAEFHLQAMPKLKKYYIDTGKLRIIYRDYPFDQMALKAAAVARCVPEENFFTFIEAIFFQQTMWVTARQPDDFLRQLASFSGLEPALFDACIKDERLIDHLLKVREAGAQAYQITSTPTLVFDGTIEKMVGAQPFESYVAAINAKLKAAGVEPPSLEDEAPVNKTGAPAPQTLPPEAP